MALSVISRPFVTAAVCVSTLLNMPSVAVMLVKAQLATLWMELMTAEAILWMNDGAEPPAVVVAEPPFRSASAVEDANEVINVLDPSKESANDTMNVVEAGSSEMALFTNWRVVDENALAFKSSAAVVEERSLISTVRSANDCAAFPTEAVRLDIEAAVEP